MSTTTIAPTGVSPPFPTLPGVSITSTREILGPDSVLCQLIWAPSGYGKTRLAGGLDALTTKYLRKRTLYIPVEAGEGGGAATLRKLDLPIFVPKDYSDLYRVLGLLRNDKSIGGVVLDSASEFAKQYVKPAALKYPCRENTATRSAGIATRSDYQVMGELMSQILRAFIGMTTHADPAYRKHIIITATDVQKEEDERVTFVGPDLPGRMRTESVQMFNQVGTITLKPVVVDGKRVLQRYLTYQADGVRQGKDRYEIYPPEILIGGGSGPAEDLTSIYEKYWVPNMRGGSLAG